MIWHPDVPNLPIKKPKRIEAIEKMDPTYRESLPQVEVQELVDDAAEAVAKEYKKEFPNGTHERCIELVSVALTVTGSAIGGQVGNAMIAQADKNAERVATMYFGD